MSRGFARMVLTREDLKLRDRVLAEYTPEPMIDWPRVAEDLRGRGVSVKQVAQMTDCSYTALRDWLSRERRRPGAGPHWRVGQTMVGLHARLCGASLPVRECAETGTEVTRGTSSLNDPKVAPRIDAARRAAALRRCERDALFRGAGT